MFKPKKKTFADYSLPDLTAIYPDPTTFNTEAWWVRGAGTNEISDFVTGMTTFSKLQTNLSTVTYTELTTKEGLCRLTNFTRDCQNPWAGTGTDIAYPLSVDFAIVSQQSSLAPFQTENDISVYPLMAHVVAIVHCIRGLSAPLVLTRSVLARIYRKCDLANTSTFCVPGGIQYWNDPDILATNPGQEEALTNAGEIRLLVRSDSSGSTRAFRLGLESFDAGFATMMQNVTDANSGSWPGIDVVSINGVEALAGQFLNDAYTPSGMTNIGYTPLKFVDGLSLQTIGLTTTTREQAIFPVLDSTTRGFYENVMNYPIVDTASNGNYMQFVSLVDAQNTDAWPFLFLRYLVLRLRSERPGSKCENRVELLRLVERLYDPYNTLTQALANSSQVRLTLFCFFVVVFLHICKGKATHSMNE